MDFHEDPMLREEAIRSYLLKRLDFRAAEAFESHYLACDECFEELQASRLLMAALGQSRVDRRLLEDVVVFRFREPVQLVRQSEELSDLLKRCAQRNQALQSSSASSAPSTKPTV